MTVGKRSIAMLIRGLRASRYVFALAIVLAAVSESFDSGSGRGPLAGNTEPCPGDNRRQLTKNMPPVEWTEQEEGCAQQSNPTLSVTHGEIQTEGFSKVGKVEMSRPTVQDTQRCRCRSYSGPSH